MFDDDSPYVSKKLLSIFGDDWPNEAVDDLLLGNIDIDTLDFEDEACAQWLEMLQMTPAERALDPTEVKISSEEFRDTVKEGDKTTPSSFAGILYTLWKAVAEKPDFCKYICLMGDTQTKHAPDNS